MFVRFTFTHRQIDKFYKAAIKDFRIAEESDKPEVKFQFVYNSLLKLAIAICAKSNFRVKA